MSYLNRTTQISSLPELDDIESRSRHNGQENLYPNQPSMETINKKYIRNNHTPSSASGMTHVPIHPQYPNQNPQYPNQNPQNHHQETKEQVMFMEEYEVPKKDENEALKKRFAFFRL